MPSTTVTVTTTPTLLCAAKPGSQRQWITLAVDVAETADVHLGASDVTATTGLVLEPGFGMTIENDTLSKPAASAWYGIVAAGSVDVTVTEGV